MGDVSAKRLILWAYDFEVRAILYSKTSYEGFLLIMICIHIPEYGRTEKKWRLCILSQYLENQ